MHDKKSLLEALMNNADFQAFGLEEIIIRDCLISEKWIRSSNAEKQDQRRKFLALCQRRKGGINVVYYENMIVAYDCMLKFLNLINSLYETKKNMKSSILLQRIIALLLIEIDNIDEDILPRRHIPTSYFQNLADLIKVEMPEVDLTDLLNAYNDMYMHWEL